MARQRNREEIQQSIEDLAYRESQLTPIVKQLEEEKELLETEVAKFTETSKNEISNLKADLEGYAREIKEKVKAISTLDADIKSAKKSLKDINEDITTLVKESDKQRQVLEDLDKSVESGHDKIKELKDEVKAVLEEIDIKQVVNAEVMVELEATCLKRQTAQKELESVIAKLKESEKQMEVAKAFVAAKDSELAPREEKLAQGLRELEDAKKLNAEELDRLKKIREDISNQEAELLIAKDAFAIKEKEVNDREQAVIQRDDDLTIAKAKLREEIKRAKLEEIGII